MIALPERKSMNTPHTPRVTSRWRRYWQKKMEDARDDYYRESFGLAATDVQMLWDRYQRYAKRYEYWILRDARGS